MKHSNQTLIESKTSLKIQVDRLETSKRIFFWVVSVLAIGAVNHYFSLADVSFLQSAGIRLGGFFWLTLDLSRRWASWLRLGRCCGGLDGGLVFIFVRSGNKETVRDFEAIGRFQTNIKFLYPSSFLCMFKNFKF